MIVVISILGGLSFSRLYQNNGWSFIQQSQMNEGQNYIKQINGCFADFSHFSSSPYL